MENISEENSEKLYQNNFNEWIKINQMINSSIEYNDDIKKDNVFFNALFKDLRNGKKGCSKEQWKL